MIRDGLLTICVMLLLPAGLAEARTAEREKPGVSLTYGLEWGYSVSFASSWHHNFFADEGYERINERGNSFHWHSHGEILGHVGIGIGNMADIAVYTGYSGIAYGFAVIPFSLRFTWLYGRDGHHAGSQGPHGWFSFIDLGSGICPEEIRRPYCAGKVGAGYRIALSRHTGLDFLLSYRLSYASPGICYDGEMIHEHDINRNDNYFSAITLSIGITF